MRKLSTSIVLFALVLSPVFGYAVCAQPDPPATAPAAVDDQGEGIYDQFDDSDDYADAITPTCSYFDTEATHIVLRDGIHPGPSEAQCCLKDAWPTIPPKDEDGECTW